MHAISRAIVRILRWAEAMSGIGVAIGCLFLAASLTPSLIPRTWLTQGALSGVCLAVGYSVGVLWRQVWLFLGLREPRGDLRRLANLIVLGICLCLVLACLWKSVGWQNGVRAAMNLAPVDSAHPIKLTAIALTVFVLLLAVGRLIGYCARTAARWIGAVLPRRAAMLVGFVATAMLFWSIGSDYLVTGVFRVLDSSYREFDGLFEPDQAQPADPNRTGGAASLVAWNDLGRMGRRFVAGGPTAAEITTLTGRPAREPIRVYVGLNSAETAQERAKLALAELKRAGGFDRKLLIVVTPTGTGWVDPAAMNSVEYLHDGDVSGIAVQYSYLSSPLSLLAQPEYGGETALALFREIYGYWSTLPAASRPRFYLHGLSLGALNSETPLNMFGMIGDPIDGALWSGPPFASTIWRTVTQGRNAGTPQWLPQYQDGSVVRFMNQNGSSTPSETPWGRMRVVYLQYASDAITFFDLSDLYRRPDWMKPPRGPDVSAQLEWYPVVTMLQMALDMLVANTAPLGHGHAYSPGHYLDAWIAVTNAQGKSPEEIAAIKQLLLRQATAPAVPDSGYDKRGG